MYWFIGNVYVLLYNNVISSCVNSLLNTQNSSTLPLKAPAFAGWNIRNLVVLGKDAVGKGYIDIVDSMNKLGETIIVGTKPENV